MEGIVNNQMNLFFDKWLATLERYHAQIESSVEELRQHKAEIQVIKQELYERVSKGRFIQSNERIIISAPEIVIGNVDKGGQLKPGSSNIILRGTNIKLEGVGREGSVMCRSTTISNVAVDPGPEGNEDILYNNAKVITQARGIVIDSNNSDEIYTHNADEHLLSPGISIHSDSNIHIDASISLSEQKECIEKKSDSLKGVIERLKKAAKTEKDNLIKSVEVMEIILSQHQSLCEDDVVIDSNTVELGELNKDITSASYVFFKNLDSYLKVLSELAEECRQKRALDSVKSELGKSDFLDNYTGTQVNINGECINLTSFDGDNNLRENEATGINIQSKYISLNATDLQGTNIKDGSISIHGENVELSTHNHIVSDDNLDIPAEGKLIINSKEINITSIDSEKKKDEEEKEKALTEEGKLSIRVKNIDISGTDTEGTPVGSLSINEKDTTLGTLKKDDSGNETVEEGTLSVKTTAISVGVAESTKTIAMESEEVSAKAKKSYKVDQDGKASLELSDDKIALKSSKKEIDGGKSTFKDDADFQGNLTAKQAKIQQLEVSTKFKSPSIQDGM